MHSQLHLAKNPFCGQLALLCAAMWLLGPPSWAADPEPALQLAAGQNEVIEWTLESSKEYANPFTDVQVDAIVVDGEGSPKRLPGFWRGGNRWGFRFSSPSTGDVRFTTECSDAENDGLHGKLGVIAIHAYDGTNPLYRHGPIRLAKHSRHFEHADGTPFFWLADSWWHGMTTRLDWPHGFKLLAADRKQKGFSVIQFAIAFPCDIRPLDDRGANEAGHAWTKGYETLNPQYFDLVDQRVEWLAQQGLVSNIVGAWGYYLPEMGAEKMRQHWRYLVARYGAYPVTWTVCGEATLPWYLLDSDAAKQQRAEQRQGWSELAKYIAEVDPYSRLRTVHPGPGSGDLQPLADMSTLDFVMIQPGHKDSAVPTAMKHLGEARKRYPKQAPLIGEACFEGMHGECKEKIQRLLFWGSVLSGAPGFCYGADGIWQFNSRAELFGPSPNGHIWGNAYWEEARNFPGAKHVGLGRRILAQYPWEQLEAHPEWVSDPATPDNVRGAYAGGVGEHLRLVYLPEGVPPWGPAVQLLKLPTNKELHAAYIDPLTGRKHELGSASGNADGTWQVPPAPILQDWLLVVEIATPAKRATTAATTSGAPRLVNRIYSSSN